MHSVLSQAVIGITISKRPCLFQFDQQGAPEEVTENLPFVAIGSGQSIADPFLAFLRRIFWKEKTPTLADGIFATLWTLDHAIAINPGGVAEPKQIVVLKKEESAHKARELSENDFNEHYQAIEAAEKSLSNFRESLGGTENIEEATPPPQP